MIYNYIVENYKNGDPIFFSELPGESKDYLRQEMKQLVDDGRLERLYNGVYYLPYQTILGTKGRVSMDRYIEKKYLNVTRQRAERRNRSMISLRCGFSFSFIEIQGFFSALTRTEII